MSEPEGSSVVAVVGNPRPASRTYTIAHTLANAIASELGLGPARIIDLAELGTRIFDVEDPVTTAAVQDILDAPVLVVASPTYKGTYSGLLKLFLDRIASGALARVGAVPMLLGGAPNHQLAVDVHLTPLLLELGASIPVRGLFVLESELDAFPTRAVDWARQHAAQLTAAPRNP